MFTQDHKSDFSAILKAKKPFCLVRFGDGEKALIDGNEHKSADSWWAKKETWLRTELTASLCAKMDSYCLGLPPACCHHTGLGLRAAVNVPLANQTFSTIFMHGNLPRARELEEHFKNAVLINADYGEIRIPADGVTKPWDVDGVVEQLLLITERPILMAAGPCANLIAYRYWRRQQKHLRVPIIDVGSPLDVVRFKINRYYHGQMNEHECIWHEPNRAARTPATADHVRPGAEKIRIGQKEPTPGVRKIKPGPMRHRIGKR